MPTIQKKVTWSCCSYSWAGSQRPSVHMEVVSNQEGAEYLLHGNRVYDGEAVPRFCPTCGTAVPEPKALLLIEELED